jgi:hypothetical protein
MCVSLQVKLLEKQEHLEEKWPHVRVAEGLEKVLKGKPHQLLKGVDPPDELDNSSHCCERGSFENMINPCFKFKKDPLLQKETITSVLFKSWFQQQTSHFFIDQGNQT